MATRIVRMTMEVIAEIDLDDPDVDPERTEGYLYSAGKSAFRNVRGASVTTVLFQDGRRRGSDGIGDPSPEHQAAVNEALAAHGYPPENIQAVS